MFILFCIFVGFSIGLLVSILKTVSSLEDLLLDVERNLRRVEKSIWRKK